MKTGKTLENKSQSVVNGITQKQEVSESTFQFVDNRPEKVAQRKLQELADNSPQVKQAAQLQAMANNHFSQKQQPFQKKEIKTGLPDNLKTGIENLSGYSMDDVKVVHRNSDKPSILQAHAYAQGTDIHLGPGQEKHLPHEAWHVVQQKQGRVKPTLQLKGKVNVNDDVGLEKEADLMGKKTLQFAGNHQEMVVQKRAQEMIFSSMTDKKSDVSSAPIQLAEMDAIAKANEVDNPNVYASWGAIVAARELDGNIANNWKAISDAYLAPPKVEDNLQVLYDRTNYLANVDTRHWSEPQARREGEALIEQLRTYQSRNNISFEPPGIQARINALKNHFLMAVRKTRGSWLAQKVKGADAQTKLELPTGGSLELWNKKEPTSGNVVPLGAGGAGYGRHGRFDDGVNPVRNVFVKKQRLKMNEAKFSGADDRGRGAGSMTPLYEQAQQIQDINLGLVEEEQEKFRAELTLAMSLDHVNIGKTFGGAIGIGSKGEPKGYVVQEMISGGDLNKAINQNSLTEAQKISVMKGALAGLAYLHNQGTYGYVHRDIKPENIMLAADGTAKLIDFGESKPLDANLEYRSQKKAGTAGYYADKIVNPVRRVGDAPGGPTYTYDKSTDLFAMKQTFIRMQSTTAGVDAWLGTFDNPGPTAAALRITAPLA